jgi:hypothetical protein
MFGKMSRVLVVVVALFMLVGTVSAQINLPANGYLGGDSLFCSSARGCWLLNSNRPANGSVPVLLGEFPQADIQGALATCAAEAHNVIIGTIQGTFGPFTLSAVYDGPNADPVCSLQINAFESEGKESKPYGFAPKADGSYSPVPQPVAEESASSGGGTFPPPLPDICNGSGAKVGDNVQFFYQSGQVQGVITYIDGVSQLFGALPGYLNIPCADILFILP